MSIKLGPVVGSTARHVVGATAHNKVKIWVQTDNPSALECRVYTDAEGSNQVPNSSPHSFQTTANNGSTGVATIELPLLQEDKRYYYRIFEGSLPISEMYSFRSFPALNNIIESFSFGLVSCNKPKSFDHKNELSYRNMWSNLFLEMSRHNAAFILLAGDQVYADHKKFNAWKKSLDAPQNSLGFYRDAYYKHWNFHEMQMILRNFPSFMIWDDHEITNGWGSSNDHNDNSSQDIFNVARKVYEEFQHSHNPATLANPNPTPGHKPYYYAFRYGPVAFLVLDLRGNRKSWNDQLLGDEQWQALVHWFNSAEARDSRILFLVSSVPMTHLKKRLAGLFSWLGLAKLITEIADQWSAPHNKMERRRLLRILFDNYIGSGNRQVFILSGDVHVGTFATITERNTGKIIYQFTSSPISNKPGRFLDRFLKRFSSKFTFHLDANEQRPLDVEISKRYRQRNFGVVTVELGPPPKTTFRMYQEYEGQPDVTSVP